MYRTKVLRLFNSNIHSYRPISTTSSRCGSVGNENRTVQNVDDLFKTKRYAIKPLTEHPIIVKKFFVSEISGEQMLYPEVLSKHEFDRLHGANEHVAEYVDNDIQFDGKGISASNHDKFKQLGLYGHNVAKEFGGAGYTYTETILASEPEAQNIAVAMIMNAHRLVCYAINEYGMAEQKSTYLPKLASGELVATTAFQEWNKDDIVMNKTTAKYDGKLKKWRLNGKKSFVVNAAKSNLFLVSAVVPQTSKEDSLSIFLVDGSVSGVSVHKKDITLGHTDVYQSDVSFADVILPEDALLSMPGSGRHIERTTEFLSRLLLCNVTLAQMKQITKYMLSMVDAMEQKKRISEPESVSFEANPLRVEASKAASNKYAAESMLYLTAGLWDLYGNTNIDTETAILKIFSQNALLSMAMELSNFVDISATVEEHPVNHLIRNAVQLQTFGESKDILKLFIGVSGIQHSGDRIYEDVKKRRNPLFHPEHAMRRFWGDETMDKYKSDLKLIQHVVSEFDKHANWLEASIQRLRIGSTNLMTDHGRNLLQQHGDIQRLAEAATFIYASFAALVRANRSWILKLPGAEQERVLAGCCCDMLAKEVKQLMENTEDGPIILARRNYLLVAKQLMKTKSYFPVHPLTRFM